MGKRGFVEWLLLVKMAVVFIIGGLTAVATLYEPTPQQSQPPVIAVPHVPAK